jgi:hypothetical protein
MQLWHVTFATVLIGTVMSSVISYLCEITALMPVNTQVMVFLDVS